MMQCNSKMPSLSFEISLLENIDETNAKSFYASMIAQEWFNSILLGSVEMVAWSRILPG